jgi:hypothetical protein
MAAYWPTTTSSGRSRALSSWLCALSGQLAYLFLHLILCNCPVMFPASSSPDAQWLMQPALPSPPPHPDDDAALALSFPLHPTASTAARPPLAQSPPASLKQRASPYARTLTKRTAKFLQSRRIIMQAHAARNPVSDGVSSSSSAPGAHAAHGSRVFLRFEHFLSASSSCDRCQVRIVRAARAVVGCPRTFRPTLAQRS